MKERIREIAGELLSTAALRALRSGDILAADAAYPAFADRFPYQETEDQARAIGDVLADMASGRPMDRMMCGDVGFGKKEVALRPASLAAIAGVKISIVCTTRPQASAENRRVGKEYNNTCITWWTQQH